MSMLPNQDALENVQNFNYLGSTISRSGDMSPELNNRLGRAASTFNNLLPIMRQKSIRLSTKLAIYRAAVITTLLYGAEAWNTTVAEEKRLAAFHTRCLRRILGVSWYDRMTNKEVFDRTGDTSLIDYLRQKRLRWLGHVVRMSPERLPIRLLFWNPCGRRRPGRQRMRWQDSITRDLQSSISFEEAVTAAQSDRSAWRSFVLALCGRAHGSSSKKTPCLH